LGILSCPTFGKLGILAWLQSVVLITPGCYFFGLFAVGIYINLWASCSWWLRLACTSGWAIDSEAGQDAVLRGQATEMNANSTQSASQTENTGKPADTSQPNRR